MLYGPQKSTSFRIGGTIAAVILSALLSTAILNAQQEETFRGQITDSACATMPAGAPKLDLISTTPQCTTLHGKGAKYVLADAENKVVYRLDDQKKTKAFAGQDVVIIGILDKDAGMIHVYDISRALSPKLSAAKSVYIDCDACPRGMAAAWLAAFQELTVWGRYDVVPDPTRADLIFLLSANYYLGDFLTRDGPDRRPVAVDITYMDIVSPDTGESLWADSRQWGSWFVSRATKDLIDEFRARLETGEDRGVRILSLMDEKKAGKISKKDFMDYMEAEFDRLDADNDGYLDAPELRQLRVVDVGK